MSTQPETFGVSVEEATFVPDEDAIREFVKQLRSALENDPALRKRLEENPREVLFERGVPFDLQTELLIASGLGGGEAECGVISCLVTEIGDICGGSIVIVTG
jgi:hypothetical protein